MALIAIFYYPMPYEEEVANNLWLDNEFHGTLHFPQTYKEKVAGDLRFAIEKWLANVFHYCMPYKGKVTSDL